MFVKDFIPVDWTNTGNSDGDRRVRGYGAKYVAQCGERGRG